LFKRCSLVHAYDLQVADNISSALPILRELGAQQGGTSLLRNLRKGETSMLKVWVGLEARKFLQASIESVSAVHDNGLNAEPY